MCTCRNVLQNCSKDVSCEFDEFIGSILSSLQAALLVLELHYVGEYFHLMGGVLLFFFFNFCICSISYQVYVVFLHCNGWCWYFCFINRWGILS